ncbi:hypothetical protein [Loktanella sp. 3ANDIMAR09]|uniref:hypothetical protein n=1 Tax=Loktanella sp. 3ANDIMAR09 TaxID=1225657 RepID=UPI000ABF22D9|nr:hypothetical protein [Loktanella sp. 3ANDIMAR09]
MLEFASGKLSCILSRDSMCVRTVPEGNHQAMFKVVVLARHQIEKAQPVDAEDDVGIIARYRRIHP